MKTLLVSLLTLTISVCTLAQQTITGSIKNSENYPIPLATIQVLNTNKGAISDENGEFQLALQDGVYELEIKVFGLCN